MVIKVKEDVLFEIKELHHLIGKLIMKTDMRVKYKPTASQIRFIDYLASHKDSDVYQSDLEKEFNISRATVYDVLNTLEKNGIIERVKSNIDTRKNKIILNKDVLEFHESLKERISNINTNVIKDVSKEDLDTFFKVSNKMKDNLHKLIEGCDKRD